MKYILTHLFKLALLLLLVTVLYEVAAELILYYYSLELTDETPSP
jgi:hypothetical protein